MAMAFLFSKLLRTYRGMKIADNPCVGAISTVIDHGLREGSDIEAMRVTKELRRMGIKAIMQPLSWKAERQQGLDPRELPNLEGLARQYRYRMLGSVCRHFGAQSLFFAHHSDDQYETVLMRLLAGHGYRGLQGVREANAIPECYNMHGVYKSGLLDDQQRARPSLSFRPPVREIKRLRSLLRDERMSEPSNNSSLEIEDYADRFPVHQKIESDLAAPHLKSLATEDGGVMIYRPLLEFDKDRLVATCESNNIQWFEDHTNLDPTLTTRNAIRYLVRNHDLPRALQKPAILDLSRRSKRRTRIEEAEAHRFLIRESVIKNFDPNAGTLIMQLPHLKRKLRSKRRSLDLKNPARRDHLKLIMAVAVRKVINFITPEYHQPPLNNLENTVLRLFPELASDTKPSDPKAFVIAGVHFDPLVTGSSVKWFLSRTPYSSNQPLPCCKLHRAMDPKCRHNTDHRIAQLRLDNNHHLHHHYNPHPARTTGWRKSQYFDGRFWVRIATSNRALFHVRPFQPEHAKSFRKSLSPHRKARLEQLLKYFAPGKVRYTLPALFCSEREYLPGTDHYTWSHTLLALPTLGIHVPGLERWVRYEARYKKVDATLLGHQPKIRKTVSKHRREQGILQVGRRKKNKMSRCGPQRHTC